MNTLVNFDIEVLVECSYCRKGIKVVATEQNRSGDILVTVDRCENCLIGGDN